jgi:pyruvate/2-oxoglutarate dehydrogenase complex dihydrolipoamide acyltransferase (E2) component
VLDVTMPKWGDTMQSGVIIEWMVGPGETIEAGEVLATVETEKVLSEITAPVAGTVVEILVEEGDEADVGDVVARLEPSGG